MLEKAGGHLNFPQSTFVICDSQLLSFFCNTKKIFFVSFCVTKHNPMIMKELPASYLYNDFYISY